MALDIAPAGKIIEQIQPKPHRPRRRTTDGANNDSDYSPDGAAHSVRREQTHPDDEPRPGELVIVARTESGVAEIARHRLSALGNPRIVAAHYPHHRKRRIGTAPAQTPPALPRPR
jgi:hypothetical protein